MNDGQTPSQTVGPYFTMRLAGEGGNVIATPDADGQRIRIEGVVYDGDRKPIEDAFVELWQANAAGHYAYPLDAASATDDFTGFGRCATDFHTGAYSFLTIKPGPVPHPDGSWQAPHVGLIIQARGMLNASYTRIYFSDCTAENAADTVMAAVPEDRRSTLIAVLADGDSVPTYRFDIRFQGADETVLFDA